MLYRLSDFSEIGWKQKKPFVTDFPQSDKAFWGYFKGHEVGLILYPSSKLANEYGIPAAENQIEVIDGKKTINVDTEKFETNQKGIYAVGDICNYPGKLKLILSGFHEGALAARACFKLARPDEKYRFEFTTSSKTIKNRLGVKE